MEKKHRKRRTEAAKCARDYNLEFHPIYGFDKEKMGVLLRCSVSMRRKSHFNAIHATE